ncbi:MAG: phage terminase large subunit [Kofleriaceae bacterium]
MSGSRFIDLAISVRIADVEHGPGGRPRWKPGSDVELERVGGRWDRRKKQWLPGKTKSTLVLRFHRGQEEAARWFVEWLRRYARNDWAGCLRVWSALLIGGRRSGKTHVCCAIMIIFAILNPRALLWALSPTLETGDELDQVFKEMLPRRWYTRRQAKTGRSTTYRLANGSRILLKSGVKPQRLKAGRVDMVLINEAQEQSQLVYVKVRAPVADRGGIVLLAANPPETPAGRWVEKHYLAARAGEIDAVVFELNPEENPWIQYEGLTSMAREVDSKTYKREVLGLFEPIGDTVFHEWSDRENWKDPPPGLVDITAQITAKVLGRAAGDVVGLDFQRIPSMVGIVHRFFRDPEDPTGDPLLWVVDEAVVDEADENELVDVLESIPRWELGDARPDSRDRPECYRGWVDPTDRDTAPRHSVCVMDASGFFQDGDHTEGKTSDKHLRARRWTHLHKPQKDSDRNPAIVERMKAGNAALKVHAGKRRLFVARHCAHTAEALRQYENKNGVPNRRSQYAHIVDAVTYVVYRFFGRPKKAPGKARGYRSVGPRFDRGDLYPRI